MKKLSFFGRLVLIAVLCLIPDKLAATAIRGTLLNGSGSPLPKGQLTFTLSSLDANNNRVVGCAAGTAPNIQGGGTISSVQPIPIVAGVGGALLGTVIGNDQINCGSGFGVGTFYHVVATDAGGAVAWTNDYKIQGATWTPAATPLNVLPPGAVPLVVLLNPVLDQTIIQPSGTSLTVQGTFNATLTGNAATATQLAATPTGCSASQYAIAIDSRADLTCSTIGFSNLTGLISTSQQPATTVNSVTSDTNIGGSISGQNLTLSWLGTLADARLANSYSGVGACGSHQVVSSLSRNAGPGCIQLGYSDISGTPQSPQNTPAITNQFFTAYNSTTGAFSQLQPSFSNISGTLTTGQEPTTTVNSVVNDANVTGSISSQTLTLAWTGTAAKNRLPGTTVFTDQANTFGAFLQKFQAGNNFNLTDSTDLTKILKFDLSNITAGQTRVANIPDANSTLSQNFSPISNQFLTGMSAQGLFSSARPACASLSDSSPSCSIDATIASNITSGILPAARLPNPSSTTLGGTQSLAPVSHKWINTISTAGVPSATQPASSDLSDVASLSLKPASSDNIQFVSSNGNDSNDGLSWGSARLTCAAALTTLGSNPGYLFIAPPVSSDCVASTGSATGLNGFLLSPQRLYVGPLNQASSSTTGFDSRHIKLAGSVYTGTIPADDDWDIYVNAPAGSFANGSNLIISHSSISGGAGRVLALSDLVVGNPRTATASLNSNSFAFDNQGGYWHTTAQTMLWEMANTVSADGTFPVTFRQNFTPIFSDSCPGCSAEIAFGGSGTLGVSGNYSGAPKWLWTGLNGSSFFTATWTHNLTANRTVTAVDADSNTIRPLASPGSDHKWVQYVDNTGLQNRTQPASADISDGTGSGLVVRQTSPSFLGSALFPDGTVSTPGIALASETNTGIYKNATGDLRMTVGGVDSFRIQNTDVTIPAGKPLRWGSAGVTSADLSLSRGNAGELDCGNGSQGSVTCTFKATITDMLTGYRVNGGAPSGHVLRGDGTNFIDQVLGFSDLSGAATPAQLPVLIASGSSHAAGIAPDPGSTAGTVRYLREDSTWVDPSSTISWSINSQTGTSYTLVSGDRGKLITASNAASSAYTLPQASSSFPSGWYVTIQNIGAGVVTITPTTSTINGGATFTLNQNQSVAIVSDGTNYQVDEGMKPVKFNAVSHQFLISINDYGVFSAAQPAFTDISGLITAAQEPSTTVNSVVNDTNVTGSISSQAFTIGWTGTLADARITGPYSGTGSCTNQAVTGLSRNAGPTCTTLTSSYTSGTFPATAHNLLSSTHGDTTTHTVVRGDIIAGIGSSPTWTAVAKGGTNTYPKWNSSGDLIASTLAASGVGACGANQFETGDNADAAPNCSQPAFSNISGVATTSQVPALVASGASHAAGIAPDPGSSAGTTRYLREDATWATISAPATAVPINAQTGTSYTIVTGDLGKLVTASNSSATAFTLPQATGNFGANWYVDIQNINAGVVTITPTTSTINGAATYTLNKNQGVRIVSDGTNYQIMTGMKPVKFTAVTNQFITSVDDFGVFTAARPASADISDGTGTGVVARVDSPAFTTKISLPNGSVSTPAENYTSETNSGQYRAGAGDFRFSVAGVDHFRIEAGDVTLAAGDFLRWGSSGVTSSDVFISRCSANVLALGSSQAACDTGGTWKASIFDAITGFRINSAAAAGHIPVGNGTNFVDNTPATARASAGLNIDAITTHGDSIYTILATDRVVATSAALTAARIWTLPAANALNAGQVLWVIDQAGGVTSSNTLTLQRAGSDTINGGTSVVLASANDGIALISDGTSKWSFPVKGLEQGGTASTSASSARTALGLAAIAASGSGADLSTNSVTNAKAAQMAANTFKGNNTGSTANAADLTVAQTKTVLAYGPNFQQFTANGTFTIPSGITAVKVTVVAGGGAGGGGTATALGGGGGSGGSSIKYLTSLTPGGTLTITVGAGGTGVSAGNGNSGATSSVVSGTQSITTISTNGGAGGNSGTPAFGGGGGASGSGGDINMGGGGGGNSLTASFGGNGGNSIFGGGGAVAGNGTGNAGLAPGAGGGGCGSGGTNTGGAGAAGIVIFEWIS